MSVAKNLRLLRRIRGLTLEELSEQVGISVSYLSRIESGNRRVTEPLLFKLSELLQCDPTEILSDEPPEKQIASLGFSSLSFHRKNQPEKVSELMELLEKVACQLQDGANSLPKIPLFTSHYFKNEAWTSHSSTDESTLDGVALNDPTDWVSCPPELTNVKNAFAYNVVNEDMAPRYNPGDIVFANPQKPLMPGCFALVINHDNTSVLRQFVKSNGDLFILKSYQGNKEETLPADSIKGIYRVVGSRELA